MEIAAIKERLKQGGRVTGTMVTVFQNPDIVKMLKVCGFDYILIDCEHGCFDYSEAARLIGVARAVGMAAIVRIPEIRREPVLKYIL